MRRWMPVGLCLVASACNCSGRLNANDAAKACLVLQACFPREWSAGYWGGSLTACTSTSTAFAFPSPGALDSSPPYETGLEGPMGDIYRCLVNAGGDCSKAGLCWAINGGGGACMPPSGLAQGVCNGTTLSGCTLDGYTFNATCGHYNSEVCGTTGVFFATYNGCDFGPCTQAQTQCRGSKAEVCFTSAALLDCGRFNESCQVQTDGGGATCVGSQSCDPNNTQATCDGTVAVTCNGNGTFTRTDCASFPVSRRCQSGACTYTGNACDQTLAPSCNNQTISFCQDGFVNAYDCTQFGFSGCSNGQCKP